MKKALKWVGAAAGFAAAGGGVGAVPALPALPFVCANALDENNRPQATAARQVSLIDESILIGGGGAGAVPLRAARDIHRCARSWKLFRSAANEKSARNERLSGGNERIAFVVDGALKSRISTLR